MPHPWRSPVREIRERFKGKTFFRDHNVFVHFLKHFSLNIFDCGGMAPLLKNPRYATGCRLESESVSGEIFNLCIVSAFENMIKLHKFFEKPRAT